MKHLRSAVIPLALLSLSACQCEFAVNPGEQVVRSEGDISAPRELCGIKPGAAAAVKTEDCIRIGNNVLSMVFSYADSKLVQVHHQDLLNGIAYRGVRDPFVVGLGKGGYASSGSFKIVGEPAVELIKADENAIRAAERLSGVKVVTRLRNEDKCIDAVWSVMLRDNAPYMRYELELTPTKKTLHIDRVELLSLTAQKVRPGGCAEGVPAVSETFFAGLEHPMSVNRIQSDWKTLGEVKLDSILKGTLNPVSFKIPAELAAEGGEVEIRIALQTLGEQLYLQNVRLCKGDNVIERLGERRALKGLDEGQSSRMDMVGRNEGFYVFNIPADGGEYTLKADAELFTYSRDANTRISYDLKAFLNRPAPYRRVTCLNPNPVILEKGKSYVNSSVFGVSAPGQLRRTFNYYIEQERAHPYRQFLHYNSWYDIGYFSKFNERQALDVINTFCTELGVKRGIMPESFLLDDGWDDSNSLWNFHKGFPNGFTALGETTRAYGSSLGVWLSPWGGYGQPKDDRINAAKPNGYEFNEQGFSLSGRKYFARFKEICSEMVTRYNAGMFKFDGLGRAGRCENSDFNTDFEAAIALIEHLRSLRKDLLVNLTTGTWPSPFWLKIADTLWRTGTDHEFIGVGPDRERWISYRDQDTYESIVQGCRLFPINSLMLHGIIYARQAYWLDYDNDHGESFRNEVRSFFGSGTMLQELYVSPVLMDGKHWDIIADAAKWARKNQHIMSDMHWVGGCPGQQEVYGWAAWLPNRGVLTLRNPSDKPQTFIFEVARDFELPVHADEALVFSSPYADQRIQGFEAVPGKPVKIELKPFEVLSFDAE